MSGPRKFRREDIEDLYPLTPVQQGILFHAELAPESGLYREQIGYAIRGDIDPDLFRDAWQAAVDRHAVLRTAFVAGAGLDETHELVLREATVPWIYEDLRERSAPEREARHAALADALVREPFDLSDPPLVRLLLTRHGEDEFKFVFTFHHVLMDGWGGALLLRDVRASYAALRQGRSADLGPGPRYRDFIAWLSRQDPAHAEAYWSDALAGYEAPQSLGVDRATDPNDATSEHTTEELYLSEETTTALTRVARDAGLTLNTVTQGAWAILLSRYGGTDDVVYGNTSAGRPPEVPDVDTMVGLFVNTVPARVRVPPGAELLPWFAELQRSQIERERFEHTPLVDIHGWSDVPRGLPLFETTFTFENYPSIGAEEDGIVIDVVRESYHTRTNYPLTAICEPGPRLHLLLGYDGNRFSPEAARRLVGHWARLLEGIAGGNGRRIADLELLTAAEEQELAGLWGDAGGYEDTEVLHEWFESRAEARPDAVALLQDGAQVTYGELSRRSNQVARHLRSRGVGPEVLVGLCVERTLEMVVGIVGILKAGGAYVPLDPAHPTERLLHVIEDSGLDVLVTEEGLRATLPDTGAHVVGLDGPALATEPTTAPAVEVSPDSVAYVIYTSGSTGKPKGTPVTHRNVRRLFSATDEWFGFDADDVWTLFHSYAFDFSVWELWGALGHGGRLVVVPYEVSRTPESLHGLLGRERVTVLNQTPSAFVPLIGADGESGDDSVGSLRYVVFGGEALNVASLSPWLERRGSASPALINMYGITETTVHVTYRRITEADVVDAGQTSPVGRPIPDLRVHVRDGYGNLMPVGTPGEIQVSGGGVARGYLGRPGLTAERFVPDPYGSGGRLYRSGDGARVMANGELGFLGRIDQQVKIRGFRIELGEIESVLTDHSGVSAAVVLARGTGEAQRLVAYTVSSGDAKPTVTELRAHLGARVPDYMIPSAWVATAELPLTPHGKVDRQALPEPDESRPELDDAFVAPDGPHQELVAGIWSRVLGVERIGAHDDFFGLGGHSLLATQVVTRIRDLFKVDLPLRELFDAPTVAGVADAVARAMEEGETGSAPTIERRDEDGPAPLSFAQERLWFIDRMEGGSSAYNIPSAVRLEGAVDPERLRHALAEVVRRHESLRTVLASHGGGACQIVHEGVRVSLDLVDLRGMSVAPPEELVHDLVSAEARRGFDLSVGPLIRARLLVLGEREHVLLVTMHHAVSDGWSLGILIAEVAALYEALARGDAPSLPDLPVQYGDFAAWQREWITGDELDAQLEYWREQLECAPTSLELPTDRPRPALQSYAGAVERVEIPSEVASALRELSRGEGVTLFMTLLAAFQALLHRWSGQCDVVVGTPIAGRNRAEVEEVIGYFVNVLAMRGRFDGDPPFKRLLARTREAALGAYAHQELPFEKLLNHLEVERDLSRSPLFQAMFVLQNARLDPIELSELRLEPVAGTQSTAKFDVTLDLSETPDGIGGMLEYNTDLFDASTARRLVNSFVQLLEGVVADPAARVSELAFLREEERAQQVEEWNDTRRSYPSDLCLHHAIEARAAEAPDAVAVVADGTTLTYADLNQRANQLARCLRELGVGPEVRVGVCLDRSVEMVVAHVAAVKAGGAYLPLDPAYPEQRLRHCLDGARPAVLCTQACHADKLRSLDVPILLLDTEWDSRVAGRSGADLGLGSPDDAAYVIYTSGSTGRPKGVLNTHRGICNRLLWMQDAYGLGGDDRVLQKTPSTFDVSVWEFFWPLMTGAALVVARPEGHKDPRYLLDALASQRVSTLHFVPSMLLALLDHLGERPHELPALLRVICSGEALSPELRDRFLRSFPDVELHNLYGPTEAAVDVTATRCVSGAPRWTVPIGRPVANTRIHLLDRQYALGPVGVAGELHIGGVQVAREYVARPDLTAERFVPDPFADEPGARLYKTGDLARYLPDGEIDFLGRIDHQVKIRGFRIELGEIETILAEHRGLAAAVVVADGPADHRRLVAYTVPAGADAPTVTELRAYLATHLPDYMVPAVFVSLAELPVTAHGKVDRKALPEPDQSRPDLDGAYVAPRGPKEESLAEIWRDVLGVEEVGAHDNFFELGGDSILSLLIVTRAREAGLEILPRHVFQHPTVSELAAVAGSEAAVAAEQGPVVGPVPLTPIQRWYLEADPVDPEHFNQAVMLEADSVDVVVLERAMVRLLNQHDALRARFRRADGAWIQEFGAPVDAFEIDRVSLTDVEGAEASERLADALARLHQSLDLAAGPTVRVAHVTKGAGEPDRIAIVAHHLGVDGVSWRILLDDLQRAYEQLRLGEERSLPAKTSSYREWATRLEALAAADETQERAGHWMRALPRDAASLPRDHADAANPVSSERSVVTQLDLDETHALLTDVPDRLGGRVEDALLAALAAACREWTGSTRLLVDLEGHGREDLFEDVDLSRTVGWFTSLYPVSLPAVEGDPVRTLTAVRDELAALPDRGIPFGLCRWGAPDSERGRALAALPTPEVLFNYLGRFDQVLSAEASFRWASEDTGPARSARAARTHLLEVGGLVSAGRLHVSFKYGSEVHERGTIDRLAAEFVGALRDIIAASASDALRMSPSAFPLAPVGTEALDALTVEVGDVADLYPVTPTQQGLLFHTLYAPESGVYFTQLNCTIEGPLDVEAFRGAWQAVVDRHAILRTSFRLKGYARPLQVVHASVEVGLDEQDWSDLDVPDQEARLREYVRAQRTDPIEIDRAPLMRLGLLRLGVERWQFVWGHHHALLDGWSIGRVMHEILAVYRALRTGHEADLAASVPYREYVAWLEERAPAESESFWRGRLAGFEAPTPLGLPTPRSPAAAEDHAVLERELSEARLEEVRGWARRSQLTLNTVVQGAWALTLSTYARSTDVLFGETVSGRPADLPDVDRMVGLFINTVPVRATIDPAASVAEWLAAHQSAQTEVKDHEHVPLVQIRTWSEVPVGLPLFESLLVFESYPVEEAVREGRSEISITGLESAERTNYPLTVVAVPGARLTLKALFDPTLLDAASVDRMLSRFETLLETLPDHAETPIGELPLTSDDEREQLASWNETGVSHDVDVPVWSDVEAVAAARPDAVAVVSGRDSVTFGALNERANRLARRLRAEGVGPDVLVGVSLPRSVDMVEALLAIVKAGGAYLPLDPTYPKDRIAYMLSDSGAPVVVTRGTGSAVLEGYTGRVFDLGAEQRAICAESGANFVRWSGPESLAYVIYTSGSTGRPKGVGVRHRGLANLVGWHRRAFEVGAADRATMVAALSFDASVWELWPHLVAGASVHVADEATRLSVPDLVRWLERERITLGFLPTPLTEAALGTPGFERLPLRTLLTGGDKLQRAPRAGLPFELVNNYGPTENTVVATSGPVPPGVDGPPGIGRPIDATTSWVVDREGRLLPPGISGELNVGGSQLARGYLARPGLTAERFVPDGHGAVPGARLYRTGDLVRHADGGDLDFLGRIDNQVKVRGFRIELGEIEAALVRVPEVAEAVVVAKSHGGGAARLVAYLVAKGEAPSQSALRAALGDELPDYMVPSAFVTLDAFPMTSGGKIDRRALPEPDASRPELEADYVAPATRLEQALAGMWAEVLGLERVGVRDNFFELGGNSLLLLQVHGQLDALVDRSVSVVELFEYPTISALASHLAGDDPVEAAPAEDAIRRVRARNSGGADGSLAVIGLAGRFPGAPDVDAFWENLRDGVESVRFFTDEELREAGVSEELIAHPDFVPARGFLDDVELFDADFFGFTPREAEITDPQHRIFLECAYEALERAGYDPARYPGLVGVYAGSSMNTYMFNLISQPGLLETIPRLQALGGNDKDFVPTKVSYKLNLRGPSLTVQTACSTSLVAFHEACRSLLDHECDMAMAGGVSVAVPLVNGYLYQPDGIFSPDGHCRAFDARGQGTISGHGVGVVVLKRLDEAIADGDRIHAVVRGTAINNDGSAKVGYTAPSVEGQAQVIAMAQAAADVSPDTVSYIETHGTATALGDPIEVAALTRVFQDPERPPRSCALGGVKTNVGHLDAAAGIAGVIKTVLALDHGQIPPSLHFEKPNPKLELASGPFYVNAALSDWAVPNGGPRRAGVSSFGIGGTNAHAILEEAPRAEPSDESRLAEAVMISAKTPAALDAAVARLADHLDADPAVNLADVAYTLRVGRGQFEHRAVTVGRTANEVAAALRARDPGAFWTGRASAGQPPVAFLFPGGGAQHVHMGLGLYRDEPFYREVIDRCGAWLAEHRDFDLGEFLARDVGDDEAARVALTERLTRTDLAQPAMFAMELAMARLWMSRGITPAACLGHSTGEYVAACLAGVLSLEDALATVTLRSHSMDQAAPGLMLAVPLPPDRLEGLLGDGLWLGAVNGPEASVLSGTPERIREAEGELVADGVDCRLLPHTNHAYHTPMIGAVIEPFAEHMKSVDLQAPTIPFVSNVTGRFITEEEARDPSYWGRQTSSTVKFADGVTELRRLGDDVVFLEVGPGTTLSSLVRRQLPAEARSRVFASLRHARDDTPDDVAMAQALGRAWVAGIEPDWDAYYAGQRRLRVGLPTYPFQRKRYWVEARRGGFTAPSSEGLRKRADVSEWFYLPGWRTSVPAAAREAEPGEVCLVLQDRAGLGESVAERLAGLGYDVVRAVAGPASELLADGRHEIDPSDPDGFVALLDALASDGRLPNRIVHAWGLDTGVFDGDGQRPGDRTLVLDSVLHLTQALQRVGATDSLALDVITHGVHAVTGAEPLHPRNATVVGLCKVVPQEYANIRCRCVDVTADDLTDPASGLAASVTAEVTEAADDDTVALRGRVRWIQSYDPVPVRAGAGAEVIRDRAVVLITGGLGQVGLAMAEHLGRAARARLVLLGRSEFPPRESWDSWLAEHDEDDATSRRIRRIRGIEETGGMVRVAQADVADGEALGRAVAEAEGELGALTGVIHAAASVGSDTLRSIEDLTPDDFDRQHRPKVDGLIELDRLLGERALDFRVTTSSLSAMLGGLRYAAYSSANTFLDAFSARRGPDGSPRWQSINSDGWFFPDPGDVAAETTHMVMTPPEGVDAMTRAMSLQGLPRVVISSGDLPARLERARGASSEEPEETDEARTRHERPDLDQPYVAPSNEVEETIAENCALLLGIDRVGVNDNFFELGGDSLIATQLMSRLRAAFGIDLSLESLFSARNIADLATVVLEAMLLEDAESTDELLAEVEGLEEAGEAHSDPVPERESGD